MAEDIFIDIAVELLLNLHDAEFPDKDGSAVFNVSGASERVRHVMKEMPGVAAQSCCNLDKILDERPVSHDLRGYFRYLKALFLQNLQRDLAARAPCQGFIVITVCV